MKNNLLLALTCISIFWACNDSETQNEKTNNSSFKDLIHGQWITEGNEGVVAHWYEFDTTQHIYYHWSSEEEKPITPSGTFAVIGDTTLQFTLQNANAHEPYKIINYDVDQFEIDFRGVSAGSLTYKRSDYPSTNNTQDTRAEKNESVTGRLLMINESDHADRVYFLLDVNGEQALYTYFYNDYEVINSMQSWIGKKVDIQYLPEKESIEIDFYVDGKSIHGAYSQVKTDEDRKKRKAIEGTLLISQDDLSGDASSSYKILDHNGDTMIITAFVYEKHLTYSGKNVTVYYSVDHFNTVKSISLSNNNTAMNTLIYGDWYVDKSNGDALGSQIIKVSPGDENGVYIDFGNGAQYYGTDLYDNSIQGKNQSGNFTISVNKAGTLLYSDDGRDGHFEPIKNQEYHTLNQKNFDLLLGKWEGINGTEGNIEFKANEWISEHDTQPYVLSNRCMNDKIHEQFENLTQDEMVYLSTINLKFGGLSYMILKLDENYLSYTYIGTGNDFEYKRVK